MKKIIVFLLLLFPLKIANATTMSINAKSGVLMDYSTGNVIFEKEKDTKLPMASMTKIMSMLLVMEQIEDGSLSYNDMVTISKEAASMGGSQVFLQEGEQYKVSDLLKSIAMASANDAMYALAEKTYGSSEYFVDQMNKKAKELNLKNTKFLNVHGLDEQDHYSSAYDMAIMARELIKHEDILKYTSVYEEYFTKNNGSQIWMVNTNKLIRFYKGLDGLKTGYTETAGYCLTATAKKNNLRLISVVMGEDSIENRSSDTVKLLNLGFNTYKANVIKSKKEVLGKVKVIKGKKDYVDVVLVNDAVELLKNSEKVSKYKFKLSINKIKAPVKKGDIVGYVKILNQDGKLINKVDITVKESILKANLWDLWMRNLKNITTFKK